MYPWCARVILRSRRLRRSGIEHMNEQRSNTITARTKCVFEKFLQPAWLDCARLINWLGGACLHCENQNRPATRKDSPKALAYLLQISRAFGLRTGPPVLLGRAHSVLLQIPWAFWCAIFGSRIAQPVISMNKHLGPNWVSCSTQRITLHNERARDMMWQQPQTFRVRGELSCVSRLQTPKSTLHLCNVHLKSKIHLATSL